MKLPALFRGKSAFLKGNFLLLTMSWTVMYFAQPIPSTYASLYYLHLGADAFLLSVIGFAGSIAFAVVQFPGGYLADKHGRRWLIATMTYGSALMAMILDSLPPESRGAGYSFQSAVTTLVLLPGPLIAQHLVFAFGFD